MVAPDEDDVDDDVDEDEDVDVDDDAEDEVDDDEDVVSVGITSAPQPASKATAANGIIVLVKLTKLIDCFDIVDILTNRYMSYYICEPDLIFTFHLK